MKKHCCDNLKELFTKDKELIRAFSILKKENGMYFIRFSSVDGINEEKFIEMLRSTESKPSFNLSIAGEVAIKYCPWCGAMLS